MHPTELKVLDGQITYQPKYFESSKADILFQLLIHSIKWSQEEMKMYGKLVKFPRLTAWYGDAGMTYRYSGKTYNPLAWTDDLLEIKKSIETSTQQEFNSVLLNYYRNGQDSMGWHADDEKELGPNPFIASINFGATRPFQIRHNHTKEKHEILLEHGSLLTMGGTFQHHWKHQIPKRKGIQDPRINLTFRKIKRD